ATVHVPAIEGHRLIRKVLVQRYQTQITWPEGFYSLENTAVHLWRVEVHNYEIFPRDLVVTTKTNRRESDNTSFSIKGHDMVASFTEKPEEDVTHRERRKKKRVKTKNKENRKNKKRRSMKKD
ncbi:hypothetical protein, partial [Aquisalimonas asiatica]|uniref:hypothetical protein n=1 Tax=Aquisalimonas asiatica TaxID=406100 RepID=UPI00149616BC